MARKKELLPNIVEEAKQELKNEKKSKKENNMKKTIITTVALTLTVIAALAGMFFWGMSYEQGINERVLSEAKNVSASLVVEAENPTSK